MQSMYSLLMSPPSRYRENHVIGGYFIVKVQKGFFEGSPASCLGGLFVGRVIDQHSAQWWCGCSGAADAC